MVDTIKHAFISAKTNSVDATLVSSNAWNDGHVLSGGINGQMLMYDDTQDNNGKYVEGPRIHIGSNTAGASASPYSASILTFNITTKCVAFLSPNFYCITSGGAVYHMAVFLNGVNILGISNINSAIQFTYPYPISLNPGTCAFSITITASAGSFTSVAMSLLLLTLGAF